MQIKNILVVFTGDKREFSALDVAGCISEEYQSKVKVSFITPEVEYETKYMLGGGPTIAIYEQYYKAVKKEFEEKKEKAKANFDEHPMASKFDWVHEYGIVRDLVSFQGKFSDIIIFNRDIEEHDIDFEGVIESAIFETGKPVLIVPENSEVKEFNNVVISWDGSQRCARAISDSLPILQKAGRVTILTIEESEKDIGLVKNLISYLDSHSVKAEHKDIKKAINSVGETLLETAAEMKSDLIVMGAFSHSRMRQMVLGGVTRYILKHADLPIFMEH